MRAGDLIRLTSSGENASVHGVGRDGDETDRALVLVVHDDIEACRLIAEGLEEEHRVALARSGAQCLATAIALRPDVVVMEASLPDIRGEELVASIRGHAALASVPLIVATGNSDPEIRETLLRSGAQAYLSRPFSIAQLRARIRRLIVQAAVGARDDLLAIVAHDLRSPLSTIRLGISLLGQQPPIDQQLGSRQIKTIIRCADQMKRLIDDLLHAATLEAGAFTVNLCREEVIPIVQQAVEDHEAQAATRSVHVEAAIAPRLPAILCDRQRLMQVLANLIGNAIKFARGRVGVRAWLEADQVRFAVSDDGPGIADDQLPRLFDRYWKGSEAADHGTGLGLYIARGIVKAHGGRIWVECQPGAGTTFYFTMQISGQAEPT